MRTLLKGFSYLFHPLLMPLLGVLIYFRITPKFVPEPFLYAKLFAITVLTVIVPILFYFLLKNLGMAGSVFLTEVKQRRIPLFVQVVLTVLLIKIVVDGYEFPELYRFFLGILVSTIMAWVLAMFKVKVSLHMVGLSGVLVFVTGLSIFYTMDLLPVIALLTFALGAVATSRLEFRAHTATELVLGVIIGACSQAGIFYLAL